MGVLLSSYLRHIREGHGNILWSPLTPLGWFVSTCSRIRNLAYDHGMAASSEPPVPVISIGNLTHGGTNKTPFVEMLVRIFSDAGLKPGIVMRGYGRSGSESLFAGECPRSRDLLGDEALLLSGKLRNVPVAVSAERMSGVECLAERGTDLVVADDGFQHRKMGRDVDIVLVDATCPFGNGRMMPAGMLREPVSSLCRAHIVVISKSDQVTEKILIDLHEQIRALTGREPFHAVLELAGWSWLSSSHLDLEDSPPPSLPVAAFSAIGNPGSFETFLSKLGLNPLFHTTFRDHHLFTIPELENVCSGAVTMGAGALVCTEKDIFNLPPGWKSPLPLFVPRVRVSMADPEGFTRRLCGCLKPRFVIASNGHGEDSMGGLMAERLKNRYPFAEILGFSLVGRGREYAVRGVSVVSPPCETPSGGVVKYRLKDLVRDIRSGLFSHISSQAEAWTYLRGKVRTVICVGDVYLLLHTLWGQGIMPVLLATAKSTRLHGHWILEEMLLKSRCRRVFTRDPETASGLAEKGVEAVFCGNPIMDLAGDNIYRPEENEDHRILLLPGSRERAYEDLPLLLDAAIFIKENEKCSFMMVVAATIERERLLEKVSGWIPADDNSVIRSRTGETEVTLFFGNVADAAAGSDILIGLGGTANQICAGLGLPVISIDEKGKRVQKKLLGNAEVLVAPDPRAIADETIAILRDPERREMMSEAGKERMGGAGGIDAVIGYASVKLGWRKRYDAYMKFLQFTGLKGEMKH